jgi:hypothetical protein
MSIYLDILIVIFLSIYLVKEKQLNFLNPTFLYLVIHVFFVTFRSVQIFFLNSIIISNRWYATFVTLEEIDKAIFLADLSLVSFFAGFYMFTKSFKVNGNKLIKKYKNLKEDRRKLLKIYLNIVVVLGFIGMLTYAFLPGIDSEEFEGNTYTNILTSLGIISSVILLYEFGFQKKYMIFFIAMVLVYAVQGANRYRVILPLVFLLMYYLKTKNLKLPPLKFIVLGFIVVLLSFPLKEIGKSFQENGSVDIVNVLDESYEEFSSGESGDLSFIEQSAAMIGAIDMKNIIFYGKTYEPIFFFWIPKDFWKSKPRLNQWQYDIEVSGREFGEMGQISIISGESYANFRYFGVFIISFLVARWYSYLYNTFSNVNYKHRGFLLLLLFNMVLFQVWRDGLISLILFPILNYLPLMLLFFIKKPIPVK